MSVKSDVLVSVVFSARSAAACIEEFVRIVARQLEERCKDYEIVIMHGGSDDDTTAIVKRLQGELRNIQYYQLVKRLPPDAEMVAGLEQAIGDVVITLDLWRDAPEQIGAFLDAYEAGFEIVYGLRQGRLDGVLQRSYGLLSRSFVKLFRKVSGFNIPEGISDYRLLSRRVVNLVLAHPDRYDLFFMITSMFGFSYKTIEVPRLRRGDPSDKADIVDGLRRAVRILLLSSSAPLRFFSGLSLFGALLSGLYSIYVFVIFLYKSNIVEGWTTLSLQLSGLFFLLFSILAVMSEYIARIYLSNRSLRPYIIQGESSSRVLSRKMELNVTADTVPRLDRAPHSAGRR